MNHFKKLSLVSCCSILKNNIMCFDSFEIFIDGKKKETVKLSNEFYKDKISKCLKGAKTSSGYNKEDNLKELLKVIAEKYKLNEEEYNDPIIQKGGRIGLLQKITLNKKTGDGGKPAGDGKTGDSGKTGGDEFEKKGDEFIGKKKYRIEKFKVTITVDDKNDETLSEKITNNVNKFNAGYDSTKYDIEISDYLLFHPSYYHSSSTSLNIAAFFGKSKRYDERLEKLKNLIEKECSFSIDNIIPGNVRYTIKNINNATGSCYMAINIKLIKNADSKGTPTGPTGPSEDTPTPTPKDKDKDKDKGPGTPEDPTHEENKNKVTFVFSSDTHELKTDIENDINTTLTGLTLPKTKDEIISTLKNLQRKFDGNNSENIFNDNLKKENIKFLNESNVEITDESISIGCNLEIGSNCLNEKALEENKKQNHEDPNNPQGQDQQGLGNDGKEQKKEESKSTNEQQKKLCSKKTEESKSQYSQKANK